MRNVLMMTAAAAALLASGCDLPANAKANFEPASEKECAVMATVARDKFNLHRRPPNWLNGLKRGDWRPNCDWKSLGIKFQNTTGDDPGFNTVASGNEFTFHRPKFGPEGATVVVEEVDYGGHETLTTCRVSGYGKQWSIYNCKENDLM